MPIKAKWYNFNQATIAPEVPGVYEIGYESNGLVVYIGKSGTSIRTRLVLHTKRKDMGNATHFRFRKTNDAEVAERKLLLEYKKQYGKYPRFNKNLPPDDSLDSLFRVGKI